MQVLWLPSIGRGERADPAPVRAAHRKRRLADPSAVYMSRSVVSIRLVCGVGRGRRLMFRASSVFVARASADRKASSACTSLRKCVWDAAGVRASGRDR